MQTSAASTRKYRKSRFVTLHTRIHGKSQLLSFRQTNCEPAKREYVWTSEPGQICKQRLFSGGVLQKKWRKDPLTQSLFKAVVWSPNKEPHCILHFLSQESVELPLTHPEYYEEMGIKPPKGVILFGAPGTGMTFLVSTRQKEELAIFSSQELVCTLNMGNIWLLLMLGDIVNFDSFQAKRYWPKPWLTRRQRRSCAWWGPSWYKNTWATDRSSCENCSASPRNTLRLLCSSTKLMPSEPKGRTEKICPPCTSLRISFKSSSVSRKVFLPSLNAKQRVRWETVPRTMLPEHGTSLLGRRTRVRNSFVFCVQVRV